MPTDRTKSKKTKLPLTDAPKSLLGTKRKQLPVDETIASEKPAKSHKKTKKPPVNNNREASEPSSPSSKKATAEDPPFRSSEKTSSKSVSVNLVATTSLPATGPAPASSKSISKPAKSVKSKKAKAKSPSPLEEEASEQEEVQAPTSDDEELHGFSTDEDDSSDEEFEGLDTSAFDITSLPTIAKDDASVKRKLEKAKRQPTEDRGVLYLSRIPHGFYEDQLKSYFSQFGTVTRLRLSRNKHTGQSKHYGFIEFDSSSVAQIVADTMNNYLLMGHILSCKVIPKDKVHPELWIGANRKWRAVPRDRLARLQHNKPRTEAEQAKAEKRLIKRQNERKRKLESAGIKYSFEAVSYKKVKPVDT